MSYRVQYPSTQGATIAVVNEDTLTALIALAWGQHDRARNQPPVTQAESLKRVTMNKGTEGRQDDATIIVALASDMMAHAFKEAWEEHTSQAGISAQPFNLHWDHGNALHFPVGC